MQEERESASSPGWSAKEFGHKPHDGEHNVSSAKPEDEETPLSKKILAGLNDLDRAAGKHTMQMWREATNRDDSAAPPTWYTYTLLVLVVLVLAEVVLPIISTIVLAVGLRMSNLALGSLLFRATDGAIRGYFNTAGPPIGVPGEILWKAWVLSAIGLFFAACSGTRGGRIGWIVLGAVTCAIAAAGAPAQSRLAVVAITAVGWSLLSIPAFWRRGSFSEDDSFGTRRGRGKKRAARNPREVAEESAIERGFTGLADYFDQRGNLKPEILANDLSIKADDAKELRREIAGITRASNISPARKREAIERARAEGADLAQLAKKYDVVPSTLRNWMNGDAELAKADQDSNLSS